MSEETKPQTTDQDTAPDPFDPESLKIGQDFSSVAGVRKLITVVRCRKPNRHEFCRVRPGEEWRIETAIFEDRITRESYLVDRSLWPDLAEEVYPVCLYLAINRQGDLFLWPVKLPRGDGRSNSWNDSAIAGAEAAENRWVRVSANMTGGQYDIFVAQAELADPEWPELSFREILRLAFKDRYIQDNDHPMLRQLRGES